jgi:predicted TIM-barrel fold metal-dependent hydrolase
MVLVSLRRVKEDVMTECRSPDVGPMTHNVEMILDAHTHLTGSEDPDQILECMNACAVEKAFLFAPELDVATRHLTNDNLDDIRTHNDYCANVCSAAPERLLGFCTLNPTPNLANGDLERAVSLMIEEAHRCYHELGLRGAGELVPTRWYPNDPSLLPLWETLAELGMYTVFHTGIFYDGRESAYCRPVYYEVIHEVPGFKGHLAHVGWPWHEECIAVLNIGSNFVQMDPEEWGFKVDLSFGPPADWQLEVWQYSIDTLPTDMLLYASDVFWPCEPEQYREKYLQPQLGLFETATTLGYIVEEGSPTRKEYRNMIFYQNAHSHWQDTVREPQRPRSATERIEMPNALQEHQHS